MSARLAVVVPAALGLLPSQGLEDPFAEVRVAALKALGDLGDRVALLGSAVVGRSLLAQAGFAGQIDDAADVVVVCADGSAMRTEKAPGHFDPRAEEFDAVVGKSLADGSADALSRLDEWLANELWTTVAPFHELARRMPSPMAADVSFADAPFGVQYWVATWRA